MNEKKLKQLAEPFAIADLEWRIQKAGNKNDKYWALIVPYINNRAIQDRLDLVCGMAGWKNEFSSTPNQKGTLCGISIRMEGSIARICIKCGAKTGSGGGEYAKCPVDGSLSQPDTRLDSIPGDWLTKWDGSDDTNIEATKGGLSGAMKRAAVQWGIGRYLYSLDPHVVTLLTQDPKNDSYIMTLAKVDGQKNQRVYFQRPKLPEWALPKGTDGPRTNN